jgi:hypothetical protein
MIDEAQLDYPPMKVMAMQLQDDPWFLRQWVQNVVMVLHLVSPLWM